MKILVPLDGSDYGKRALAFLCTRSTLIGASPEVHLLNVQPPIAGRAAAELGRALTRRIYEGDAEAVLGPARSRLAEAGIDAETHADHGHAAERIAAIADDLKADLVVIGARGYSEFKGLLFGSVTHGVLARSKRPVLVIRGLAAPKGDGLRTGIAVDGSRYGLAAVKFALRHRDLFGSRASMTLLHVVPEFLLPVMADLGGVAVPTFSEQEIRRLQDREYDHAVGPALRLFHKAVVGSHGYGGLKAAVLGSVATRIAARCETPLLIVRAQ